MKLYKHDGQYQVPGQQSKGAEKIDVPTDSKGLCDFLNGLVATQDAESLPTLTEFAAAQTVDMVAEQRREQDTMQMRQAYTALDIEEFILDRASVAQVEQIMARIGTRFAELVKGAPQS